MSFQAKPDHTFPGRRMLAVKILAIQVGLQTRIEPPSSLNTNGTVARMLIVIVTIFGGERRATMIGKRIANSSYKVT